MLSAAAGCYTLAVLHYAENLNVSLGPAVGCAAAAAAGWLVYRGLGRLAPDGARRFVIAAASVAGMAVGAFDRSLPDRRARITAVSQLGVVLPAGGDGRRGALPRTVRSDEGAGQVSTRNAGGHAGHTAGHLRRNRPGVRQRASSASGRIRQRGSLNILGGTIKGFNLFTVGVAIVAFLGLLFILNRTSLGRSIRAIGDDEEVLQGGGHQHDGGDLRGVLHRRSPRGACRAC